MKNLNNTEGIDFVITWVDGSDPAWQQEKRKTLEACGLKSAADDRTETGITFNTGSVVWSSLLRGYVKFIL